MIYIGRHGQEYATILTPLSNLDSPQINTPLDQRIAVPCPSEKAYSESVVALAISSCNQPGICPMPPCRASSSLASPPSERRTVGGFCSTISPLYCHIPQTHYFRGFMDRPLNLRFKGRSLRKAYRNIRQNCRFAFQFALLLISFVHGYFSCAKHRSRPTK